MGLTSIQWTDRTWSPLRARVKDDAAQIARDKNYGSLVQIAEKMAGHIGPHCERVSHGCDHCYSDTNNGRCLPANGTGLPFDRRSRDLVESFVDEKILLQPLKWRPVRIHDERCGKTVLGKQAACACVDKYRTRPQRIFVENQSDLFGEWNTDEMIDRVFAVMALCPQHTFQVLTKRPERMRAYLTRGVDDEFMRDLMDEAVQEFGTCHANMHPGDRWPLPNVWLGISVEDQKTADERTAVLRKVPAVIRFVSQEPQLSIINWTPEMLYGLRWIIIGGESGPGARPFDIAWARQTIRQCSEAGVACFVKQIGAVPVMDEKSWSSASTVRLLAARNSRKVSGNQVPIHLADRKGGDMSEWPEDLRVREFPA